MISGFIGEQFGPYRLYNVGRFTGIQDILLALGNDDANSDATGVDLSEWQLLDENNLPGVDVASDGLLGDSSINNGIFGTPTTNDVYDLHSLSDISAKCDTYLTGLGYSSDVEKEIFLLSNNNSGSIKSNVFSREDGLRTTFLSASPKFTEDARVIDFELWRQDTECFFLLREKTCNTKPTLPLESGIMNASVVGTYKVKQNSQGWVARPYVEDDLDDLKMGEREDETFAMQGPLSTGDNIRVIAQHLSTRVTIG